MSESNHIGQPGVAIVGAGLVGLGWTIVFARARLSVKVFDRSAELMVGLPTKLEKSLTALAQANLIDESPHVIMGRIAYAADLAEAVEGAGYVQESVLERVDVKSGLYEELNDLLGPDTIVGSSSSGIPSSAFTAGLEIAPRCLVAHPVNPPYLIPVVELVPADWTRSQAMDAVYTLMQAVGQHPIRVTRELRGFVLNRLQGALLREAWALLDEGYCSAADIDATISKGLGMRWSFMGPFETIDLNASGGIRDYAERLGDLYLQIDRERTDPQPWSDDLIARAEVERRETLPQTALGERSEWRDRRLMALAVHMRAQEQSE